MLHKTNVCTLLICAIHLVIFLCHTNSVSAQDSEETTTASSETPTVPVTTTEEDSTTDIAVTEPVGVLEEDTTSTGASTTSLDTTTGTYGTTDYTTDFDNFTTDTSSPETTYTSPPETTTIAPNGCFPDRIPFGNGCISGTTNAALLITALVLSILSFIGLIVAGVCLLLYRKRLSKLDHRLQFMAKHAEREASKKPVSPISGNSNGDPRVPSVRTNPKDGSRSFELSTRTTETGSRQVHPNMMHKQPIMKMASVIQRDPLGASSSTQSGAPKITGVQSGRF